MNTRFNQKVLDLHLDLQNLEAAQIRKQANWDGSHHSTYKLYIEENDGEEEENEEEDEDEEEEEGEEGERDGWDSMEEDTTDDSESSGSDDDKEDEEESKVNGRKRKLDQVQ